MGLIEAGIALKLEQLKAAFRTFLQPEQCQYDSFSMAKPCDPEVYRVYIQYMGDFIKQVLFGNSVVSFILGNTVMPAYKDEKMGNWYAAFYYQNWQGAKVKKLKRGFSTKRDPRDSKAEHGRTQSLTNGSIQKKKCLPR
ncbi:hypothetical protein SDC9_67753 [bioreactor metagenome]|uniref:AP2-like integrase N-terminal domain-containing protein n=1 Tax=bioreactor metagenome TaxID=1076179 RepID=A0A644XYX5_9ZZZZ